MIRAAPTYAAALAAMLLGCSPAIASGRDDIAVSSTVRVVQHLGATDAPYTHGSGIFVAPGKVLTNAHVVRDLRNIPEVNYYYSETEPVYEVIPASGSEPIPAKVIAYDASNDLALLDVQSSDFKPALFSGARAFDTMRVTAAGYPGNVDAAFARNNLLAIRSPSLPVRTSGTITSTQDGYTIDAAIGRGFSGSALFDECGRAVGINRAVTINGQGDANAGITIPGPVVLAFLRENGVEPQINTSPCPTDAQLTSLMNTIREEGRLARDAATSREQDASRAREKDWQRYSDCQDDARQTTLLIGSVLLLLVLAALIMAINRHHAGDRKHAYQLIGVTVVLIVIIVYLAFRPSSCTRIDERQEEETPLAIAETGKLACRFDASRSLNPYLPGEDTSIEIGKGGCVNDRRVYWRDGDTYRYASSNDEDRSINLNEINLASGKFHRIRYIIDSDHFDNITELLKEDSEATCQSAVMNPAVEQGKARSRYKLFADAANGVPSELLTWSCH